MNNRPAQQLIEFLLVVPFMVIILGILTEYAYALNINMTLTEGLKTATSSIYKEIKPNMPASSIRTLVRTNLIDYLKANNVPTKTINTITVAYATSGINTVFMASYRYVPAFTLPNIYFHILPDEFNFFATSLVPSSFLQGNSGYAVGVDSLTLDSIWSGSNFSGLSTYTSTRNGIMNLSRSGNASTNKMIFLVPFSTDKTNTYTMTFWNGQIYSPGVGSVYAVSTDNGKIYSCTVTTPTCTTPTNAKTFLDNYSNVIFVHDTNIPLDSTGMAVYISAPFYAYKAWITPYGSTSTISSTNVDGALKRALALVDIGSLSLGNYDNINVSLYNAGVSTGNTYTVEYEGTRIFVHTSTDSITKIK